MPKQKIHSLLKSVLVFSGIKPSYLVSAINGCFAFGQWLKKNPAGKKFPAREDLFEYISNDIIGACPIDYLEFGVCGGTSLRIWMNLNTHPLSRFYGFDSFLGLPEDWQGAFNCGSKHGFSLNGKIPQFQDKRVKLIPGYFHQTLRKFFRDYSAQNRLLVHIDCDIYSSTLCVLANLTGHLTPGSILMFDEFNLVCHEFKAFQEICTAFAINYKILAATDDLYNHVALEII